jgi:quinol monooxygenase YgiN
VPVITGTGDRFMTEMDGAILGDVLVSEWDSQEALETHYRSEEFAELQFGLDGLLARPSELTVYAGQSAVRR